MVILPKKKKKSFVMVTESESFVINEKGFLK